MIKNLYVIYDSKAQVYSNPFIALNPAIAQREFARAVNDPQSEFYANPEDFSLFEIAQYDDETAWITKFDSIQFVQAASFLRKFNQE